MRIFLTGATGFVGSNLAHVFAERHGAEVVAPGHEHLDLTDPVMVRRSIVATRPEAIVHAAIWNEPGQLLSHRRRAWEAYVGATRNVVDAANLIDAHIVLISTDWVFDGTQGPAAENDPPHPINSYGFLKAASELVLTQRALRGTVARIAGVQGAHRGHAQMPRAQDAGFGYFVAALVQALRSGEPFVVWNSGPLNTLATPTLATDAAELVWRALQRSTTGILHCCGGEHVDRLSLAQRAARAFDLDPELVQTGPTPDELRPSEPVPRDTRLNAEQTARRLEVQLPDLATALARLREEIDGAGAPADAAPRAESGVANE